MRQTTKIYRGVQETAVSLSKINGYDGLIWGIPPFRKPFHGNLIGNIKIRYRNDDFAKVYIRDPIRIREFTLKDMGDYVTHGIELAQNQRTKPRTQAHETL